MRRRLLLLAALLLAGVGLLAGSASADTSVLNFQGSFTPPACGTPFDFPVGPNTATIDVAATADLAANDIVLKLEKGGVVLATADTATSPEAIHYAPGGPLQTGTYSAVVCPFDAGQNLVTTSYHGAIVLTELPLTTPLPSPAPIGQAPAIAFDTTTPLTFAPATVVSAHFLGGEPQETLERQVANSQSGRIDPNRVFVDWPLTSRTQTSQLSRSLDGGDSFRLLFDPTCAARNRPTCQQLGGGDSEEDVNLIDGNLLFADQEGATIQEGLASTTDHGDSFPAARQFAITNATTATDRQWLAWVDPRNATVGGQGLDAFFTWHLPGAGQYVVGVLANGVPLPQPVPQIPLVGQSGQVRVDNGDGPGRGWIYQPFGTFPTSGIAVATAFAPQYQNPAAWKTTLVSNDTRALFPWVGLDTRGNAYAVWVKDDGQLFLSASPIDDARNDPRAGGRPGTYWTPQAQLNPPSIHSTAFPEVTGGADGHIAVAYMGSPDCAVGASDNCAAESHWNVYVDVISDASQLWKGGTTSVVLGQVNHRVAHRGSICTSGTTCSGDRSLLDMMDVSYDQTGRVAVVYMDNNNKLAAPNETDTAKASPFVLFSKEVAGPSLLGTTVNVSIPTGGRPDPAGDATWPNTSAGQNLPSLDLLGASVTNTGDTLTATLKLADATTAGMARDLSAYNAASATDNDAARLQYILRLETATDVYHLSMEYEDGTVRYLGGRVDANDGVQNGTNTTVGSRYVTDGGYPVTGTLANGQITLGIPLSALGLKPGDTLLNVAAFATAAPAEDDATATIVVNSARTVDATPPFDADVAAADLSARQTASPNPAKKGKPVTFTITVANAGPSGAAGVHVTDRVPSGATLKSVSASQGSCTGGSTVDCSLGDLAKGVSATVTLVLVPGAKGTLSNTATATAGSPTDPDPSNNAATASVTVN